VADFGAVSALAFLFVAEVVFEMATISGGKKLEAALIDMARRVAKPATLQVGFFEDATYPDGTSVATVAAFNNFGTKRAPPRPFFTNMVHDKSPEWAPALAKLLKANNMDAVKSLTILGDGINGQLQQSINDLVSPPLAESTIKRKGFDKPLIDTTRMINSAGYKVNS